MKLVTWSAEDLQRNLDAALGIYCAAMGYPPETGAQRKGYVVLHSQRAGFRAVAVYDATDTVVGFTYGYQGAPGQWWHDEVRRALGPAGVRTWLTDPFELCELHVRPDCQGRGLGQQLLTAVLAGCPQETVVLSTPEGPSRAWRLYRRLGFVDVRRAHCFAGDDRSFAVLGRRLPLDASAVAGSHG
ncbi:MAG: GNAT family N-acetyltransferase [Actinomycetota bacterium]|nr:GNAT family N-acetyltransferase [Actinomycetota bacterium]